MWLHRRLGTAERGRTQLDRKVRILVPERQRLALEADRCRGEWAAACELARTWEVRVALLGGRDAIRGAAAPEPMEIEVTWTTAMGLRHPIGVTVAAPAEVAPLHVGNAAVGPAVAAFRTALLAGARTAAAEEAVRRLDAEIALTRRRIRALDKRWIPWLRESLAALDLALDQAEQEDATRLRRAEAARDADRHHGA
jgi:V/A-type H+-transporting ATPase subunit D